MKPSTMPTRTRFASLALLLLVLAAGVLTPGSQPVAQAQEPQHIYLPQIFGPPPTALYGTVKLAGQPAAGMKIDLWKWQSNSNGSSEKIATATTDDQGIYRFENVAALPAGYVYYASFENRNQGSQPDDRYVWFCSTFDLESYSGGNQRMADFDIANIVLEKPADDATVKLPVTFTWSHPTSIPGSYWVFIYDLTNNGSDTYFSSPLMENATSYKLTQLPNGFSYGHAYGWAVYYQTNEAYCGNLRDFQITFKK